MGNSTTTQLDISSLAPSVQFFSFVQRQDSSQRIFQYVLATFCSTYSVTTPFPVSEAIAICCYFSTYVHGMSRQTVKVYLTGKCYMQRSLGLSEPKEFTSIPVCIWFNQVINITFLNRTPEQCG